MIHTYTWHLVLVSNRAVAMVVLPYPVALQYGDTIPAE
jgi:hypothetical protein